MTDHSLASVPSPKKISSWNFDYHQQIEDDDQSSSSNDFFSDLRKNITKNVYFNEEMKKDFLPSKKTIERSTVHIDSSDLISRCKTFLPLLTDANRNLFSQIQSGENVRIELDSDDEEEEQTIEMNLMFCPNVDSSSSSDSDDNEEQIETEVISLKKKNKTVNIVELTSKNQLEDNAEK